MRELKRTRLYIKRENNRRGSESLRELTEPVCPDTRKKGPEGKARENWDHR